MGIPGGSTWQGEGEPHHVPLGKQEGVHLLRRRAVHVDDKRTVASDGVLSALPLPPAAQRRTRPDVADTNSLGLGFPRFAAGTFSPPSMNFGFPRISGPDGPRGRSGCFFPPPGGKKVPMLSTDAHVFLDVSDPLCAWNAVRGVLVSAGYGFPGNGDGFVSVWSASLMKDDQSRRFKMELLLEGARRRVAPQKTSRLRGLFCFPDLESAERAVACWGLKHLNKDHLADVHLPESPPGAKLDTNWITNSRMHGDLEDTKWMSRYWSGEAMPGDEPIWEELIDGRMVILGTDVRKRACETIKEAFPEALSFLEIGRAAAYLGYDVCNCFGWLRDDDANVRLEYHMDMRDAEHPDFLKHLPGATVNPHVFKPHVAKGQLGVTPNFSKYGFSRPRNDMPYVGSPNNAPAGT